MGKVLIIILYISSIVLKCNKLKKNLIIGAIKSYTWSQIKPFFISLNQSNFKEYDCVIFITDVSQNVIEKLKSLGIIIYELPDKYKAMKINNVRYKLYEEYLSDKLNDYNIVLHADIRDTFFQKDLFQLYKNTGSFIGFSLEEGNISEPMFNSEWMKNQYGEKIYDELKNRQIICSGTIWGTVDKFYELVKNIWIQIEKKSPYNYSIHDQTATNYLIYHKKLFKDDIILSDINFGPVMTVGLASNRTFSFDLKDNLLTIQNKNIAALIHQYDRIPKLIQIVERKFMSKNESFISQTIVIEPKIKKKITNKSKNKKKIYFILIVMIYFLIFIFILKTIVKSSSKIKFIQEKF